jgi:hypothetical protein
MNSVVAGNLQNQYTPHMAVRINLMFAVVPRNLNFAALVLHFVPSRCKKIWLFALMVQAEPRIRIFSYPRFTAARKKIRKLKK